LTVPSSTHIYTLSLHDALPIFKMSIIDRTEPRRPGTRLHSGRQGVTGRICNHSNASKAEEGIAADESAGPGRWDRRNHDGLLPRSEEHTSELQSRENLVCRLLL